MKTSLDYKPPRLLRMLTIVFGVFGIFSGAAMFYLENSFLWHARTPQVELGRTVAYPLKGAVFYITPGEHIWIRVIYLAFTTCIAGGIGVGVYISAKKGFPAPGEWR
jgi:phage shock protein PspC (stress-responsive transcriptional regulator)